MDCNQRHPRVSTLRGLPGRSILLLLLIVLMVSSAGAQAGTTRAPAAPVDYGVTTPREYFGYDIGQDYKLTPWQTKEIPGEGVRKGIVDYAHELERTSDRVRVFEYGTSEMGRPMILTVIASPESWAQMDDLKGILRKLADPRQVMSDAEAKSLVARGKAVYWIVAAIHASERTSPEVLVRLSYKLASGEDEWTHHVLDNEIVVIENTVNPDGLEMVTDWYYKYKGTPYESSSPPYYNKYINHDNNRDYLGLGMVESQQNAAIRTEWHPTMFHDLHETMTMLYMSPGPDPTNEAISAITVGEWLAYAGHTMTGLLAKGWTGVFTYDYASMWYPGFMNSFTSEYNSNAIFYELQGARGATPRTITSPGRGRAWYNPAPYTVPFTWRLIDAVNLEEDALRISLEYLAQNKDELLYNFYLKGKLSMEKAASESPYAFIIPANGGDNADVTDMINNLRAHLFEINRAAVSFTLDGRQYAAGDYVILTNQPYGFLAKNLLSIQKYPLAQAFDVAGWTYGLLRDVETVPVATAWPSSVGLIPVTADVSYAGRLTGDVSNRYVIEHQTNNNLPAALPQLWADPDMALAQADATFTAGGRTFPVGTFVVTTTGSAADHAKIQALVEDLGLTAYSISEDVMATPLRQPRVGLYTPNNTTGSTMPEGWVRMRLDRTGFPYTRLYKEDISGGALSGYDVIVIPDITTSGLVNGSSSSSLPPEYRGGIGNTGVENLKSFVENGGTLVAMGRASLMPIDKGWNVGVTVPSAVQVAVAFSEPDPEDEENVDFPSQKQLDQAKWAASTAGTLAETFYSPGSILRLEVDPSTRVGYGYDPEEASWSESSQMPYFVPTANSTATVVARYPDTGPLLLSGYTSGEGALLGKIAIADAPLGKGHVILLAPNTLYRAQATRTYMLFWNSLIEGARTGATNK